MPAGVTQASGFPTVSSSVMQDFTPLHQMTAVYTTGDPSTDGAHWRQQDLGGSEGPWWVGVEVGRSLPSFSPPSPCLMWPQVQAEGAWDFTSPRKRTI